MPPTRARKPSAKAAEANANRQSARNRTTTTATPAATARSTRQTNRRASDPPPDPEVVVRTTPPASHGLDELIRGITANAAEQQDAIEDLRNRYDQNFLSINEKIDALADAIANIQTPPQRAVPAAPESPSAPRRNGNAPNSFMRSHIPWVDQSLLANLVSLKLDVKDLIRLLPVEDRPKGRSSVLPHLLSVDL